MKHDQKKASSKFLQEKCKWIKQCLSYMSRLISGYAFDSNAHNFLEQLLDFGNLTKSGQNRNRKGNKGHWKQMSKDKKVYHT